MTSSMAFQLMAL